MAQVKAGDIVKVHYTGKLEDGRVFDTSTGRDPLEFSVGAGDVIEGFDQAVVGMSPGETKTATIPANEAYGPHREEMIIEVDRERFPSDFRPEIGRRLEMRRPDGDVMRFVVTDVSESTVTLDANHPLAGEDLTFDIELVEIV
jgi:peptidylprolyl isomerase